MRIHLNMRPRTKKDKTYRYYSLARSYRDENGDPKKEILEKLGQLSDLEVAAWKMRLAVFNGDITEMMNTNNIEFVDSKNYLDVALLSFLYDKIGLNDVFKMASSQKEIGVQEVAKILTISRCLDPSSNYKTVDWFEQSYLPRLMDMRAESYNKDKIFHELKNIHKKKKWIQKHFYSFSKKMSKDSSLYFFDGTTSFFEGTECELAEPGKDKTTGFQSKTILICLLTDVNGFPIAWDVFSGDKRDVTEFKKIAQQMVTDMDISNVTLCFDRGVASVSNFDVIEQELKSKFISGLCRNQIDPVFDLENFCNNTRPLLLEDYSEIKEKSSSDKKRILTINKFYKMGNDRYFRDLGANGKRRHVASFNANIFMQEKETREKNIAWAKQQIDLLNEELQNAGRDRECFVVEKKIDEILAKYSLKGIISYTITPRAGTVSKNTVQTYSIAYEVSEEALRQASMQDGLFIFITNHIEAGESGHYAVPASAIVSHYKDKFVIENAFRHLKSILDLRPFYVRLDDHVRAHVDICMCAYYLNNWIYQKLSESEISIDDFYSELKKNSHTCRLKSDEKNIVLLKTLTPKMIKILNILDANNIIEKEILQKLQITPLK